MATESRSRSKSHHSDGHRREKRDRRQRGDDNDSDGRDRNDDESSLNRKREREKRKKSKNRDRDDERRVYSRSHRKTHIDFECDNNDNGDFSNHDRGDRISKSRSKPRHRSSREKPSNKRLKKSSRSRSSEYSDEDSDHSSNYDRTRSNDRKRKKKKSSKSRQERKEKKSAKTLSTKKPDKSKLFSMGEPSGHPPDSKVNAEEDYFSYHNEFWIYLFREEGTYFNDIDNEESHAAFARFAKQYNAGMLEEPYYSRNFPNEVIEESKTTKHSWGFKTTHRERKGLGDLQKGVRRQTEYSNSQDQKASSDVRNSNTIRSSQVSCPPVDRHCLGPEERRNERHADRRLKEHVRLTHEELTGGPKDLKERQLEKKREHSARIHGAHRDHEGGAVGMELSDAALFGDDGNERNSFTSVLGRSRQKKERRDKRQKNRIQELKAKEEERQKNMLKMLGLENLQGRKKLEIAPRK